MFDVISAPRSAASPASGGSISEILDEGKRASLDYQILRRTLLPNEVEAEASISRAAEAPSEPLPITTQASDFQELAAQRRLELNVTVNTEPQQTDPLVLDLASNGFTTSGLSRAVRFDLDADGKLDQISVPTGDDALLALDRNGNGRIDNGRELFGDQNGAANGFSELRKYDDNNDGRINRQDAIFERLSLLRFDAQGRQSSQSLSQAGVSGINLQAREVNIALGAYDQIAQLGRFEFADGRSGQAADLLLAQR